MLLTLVQVLHPTQHRVLTVREYARSMGFPDDFTWDPATQSPSDMVRQIGNAVAIPVGRAFGQELLKVVIRRWERDNCRPSKPQENIIQSIEFDESVSDEYEDMGIEMDMD
jgi:hypothetical protein